MRLDSAILAEMDPDDSPLIHFYDWEGDAATYGHFVNIGDYLNLEEAKKRRLSLARRPTGGGIVFHVWDFAFSVAVPSNSPLFSRNTLDNYQLVNRAVLKTVEALRISLGNLDLIGETPASADAASGRFCMAAPTIYDVVLGGRKVAGAAQRQRKNGFLHQGTISLVYPSEAYLSAILMPDSEVLSSMKATIFPVLGASATHDDLLDARVALKTLLPNALNEISHVQS